MLFSGDSSSLRNRSHDGTGQSAWTIPTNPPGVSISMAIGSSANRTANAICSNGESPVNQVPPLQIQLSTSQVSKWIT
ncbi:hypothetical protein D9M71_735630 [compost metagenome]